MIDVNVPWACILILIISIQQFTLNFNFYEKLSLDVQTDGDCYFYKNTQVFNIRDRFVFTVGIETLRNTCI